jgi:hypothetical protein
MTGQLITFPVRLYARGARLLVHAAEDVTGKAVMGTLRLAGALGSLRPGSGGAGASAPPPAPAAPPPQAAPPPPAAPSRRPRPDAQGPGGRRNGSSTPRSRPARPQPSPASTPASDLPEPDPRIAARARRDHVSAEAVVVREEAEAGAQDGAGASISVQEPWDGYGKLNARDVVARLAASTTAELAAVQLYESAHRKRQTVITAVTRKLAKPER